ncbi:universal stress protein [Parazoarcus communis]|uniref:Universal stress protein n=1 Tax=Parazoarcus communis SWub3 = DSM 12120 TaxID=1121029 RepID=A0A323UZX3_9RHOO|nr:universal stress protein [Parazoarcus communis]NMG69782.1 universal stress protein [Parazoarcus communis SWub3 = DSM 12120]PZA18075.1 universal stress protein [Azoarcus communis] [Parazoarcus communis SWub3 = DSM 12120]
MNAVRTVLAATDLSSHARHAVGRAAMLAAEMGARMSLMHVVAGGGLDALRHLFAGGTSDVGERLLDEVRGEVRELADELGERHHLTMDIQLIVGAVLTELGGHADAIDADLLVLGARGASPLREWMLGSTTERMLRKTYRPMLVVKQIPHETYRRVLVPVDFSPRSIESLRFARQVAPQADLILLHAFEVPFEGKLRYAGVDDNALSSLRVTAKREAVEHMNTLIEHAGLSDAPVRRIVMHGDAPSIILNQEQEQDCDLIVIGKRGAGLIEEVLLGSVTKHILAQSSADVLVTDRAPA